MKLSEKIIRRVTNLVVPLAQTQDHHNPEKTITFEEIGTKIWGSYTDSDRRSIMVNTSRLRKKLEYYPELSGMIETVWSEGYKFIPKKKKGGPNYG